jgi:hypothetical protein
MTAGGVFKSLFTFSRRANPADQNEFFPAPGLPRMGLDARRRMKEPVATVSALLTVGLCLCEAAALPRHRQRNLTR